MAGYKYSQRKMRRDGLSEDAAGLPGESPPPLANIDIYSRCAYSRFRISFRPGQAESGHHLGWEWLSPHASFDESTPVQSPPISGLSTTGAPSAQKSKAHFQNRVKRRIKKGWPVKRTLTLRTKFRINKGSPNEGSVQLGRSPTFLLER